MKNNDARGVGMNAVEFVKKHGWTAVIAAVKSTTAEETAAFESKDLDPILAKDGSVIGFNVKVHAIPYVEVKRLVDSWEFVQSYSGLAMAKRQYSCFANACESVGANKSPRVLALGKAIADVESVGGGV